MKADRGLTIARMVELGGVSRASFYRYDEDAASGRIGTWTCATPSSASRWNGPVTAGPASRRTCAVEGWMVNPKRV